MFYLPSRSGVTTLLKSLSESATNEESSPSRWDKVYCLFLPTEIGVGMKQVEAFEERLEKQQ